jgi:hypothetical protein
MLPPIARDGSQSELTIKLEQRQRSDAKDEVTRMTDHESRMKRATAKSLYRNCHDNRRSSFAGERHILELISLGAPLPVILNKLCIRLVSVAASTDSDRDALGLLTNEFDNMQNLSDKITELRKSMDYIAPDTLNEDPLDQRILNCAHSLASMAVGGQFQDDGSCH